MGTEATLHQIDRADVVAFLDFDQELLAPRYRAAEQAFGLLARAARLIGGKGPGAARAGSARPGERRLVVQTFVRHAGRRGEDRTDLRLGWEASRCV